MERSKVCLLGILFALSAHLVDYQKRVLWTLIAPNLLMTTTVLNVSAIDLPTVMYMI